MGDAGEESEVDHKTYWKDLKVYCVGFMGMSVREYDDILYPDLLLKIEGFRKRRDEDLRILRRIGYSALKGSHLEPKSMPKSEKEYFPLTTDKKDEQYKFQDKKEAYKELLELVTNGASRN